MVMAEATIDAQGYAGTDLLTLALSRPNLALRVALECLDADPDAATASIAHQAVAVVLRDQERFGEAEGHFRAALRLARRAGEPDRVTDIDTSYAAALLLAGATGAAKRRLDRALARATTPLLQARIHYFRAGLLMHLGRHREARDDLRSAQEAFAALDERLWLARTRLAAAWAATAAGDVATAGAAAGRAESDFLALGQRFEAVVASRHRAEIFALAGDLPAALRLLDEAEAGYRDISDSPTAVAVERCAVQYLARLLPEARALAVETAARVQTPAPVQADLWLVAARCALEIGDLRRARDDAARAEALFRAQDRRQGAAVALLVAARADLAEANTKTTNTKTTNTKTTHSGAALTDAPSALATEASTVARAAAELERGGWAEARSAWLLAGDMALRVGDTVQAQTLFARAAGPPPMHVRRRELGPFGQATLAVAQAQLARLSGDHRKVLHACTRGLAALADQRRLIGDPQLRALATDHTAELSALALDVVVTHRGPAKLLAWTERTRAVTLLDASVRPPRDTRLAGLMTAARDAARRGAEAATPEVAARIGHERARLEARVRDRAQLLRGVVATGNRDGALDRDALLERVGNGALVSLVDVAGRLYAVRVQSGRMTRHEIGPSAKASLEAEFARFALRRTAYRGVALPPGLGDRLSAALLGPLAADLPERVIVIPPAALHVAPWGLVTELAGAELSVAPSARLWLRASPSPARGPVVLVTGPGLSSGHREAGDVGRLYRRRSSLEGPRRRPARP